MKTTQLMSGDEWRRMTNDREKYQSYLCSREWALLRNAVRERCGGKCERCGVNDMECVHHLTYANKYMERTEDLAGWCNACHEFTHGKSDHDPKPSQRQTWVELVRDTNNYTMASERAFVSVAKAWHRRIEKTRRNSGWLHLIRAMVLGLAASDRMGILWLARAADGEFDPAETEAKDGR